MIGSDQFSGELLESRLPSYAGFVICSIFQALMQQYLKEEGIRSIRMCGLFVLTSGKSQVICLTLNSCRILLTS